MSGAFKEQKGHWPTGTRKRRLRVAGDEIEEKTEKADWTWSYELWSDLGKHGKNLHRGVQDLI